MVLLSQIYTPVPDSLLSKAMAEKETNTMLDVGRGGGGLDGLATPGGFRCTRSLLTYFDMRHQEHVKGCMGL